jgi:ADP-ribosylglycohydrolase
MATALENALLALEGLSVGDAFGECFFSAPGERLRNRDLPAPPWVWTDDTHMAVSIVETLQAHGRIQQDALAGAFAKRFMAEPYRGYGKGAFALLGRIARGEDWRMVAAKLFEYGSYGIGCAIGARAWSSFARKRRSAGTERDGDCCGATSLARDVRPFRWNFAN